jgi:hypothetical protein
MVIAWLRTRSCFVLCSLACALAFAQPAAAQTWSLSRERPSLFEIIAVDPISEAHWVYGSEDVSGDGQGTTSDDEAGVDLRSVYADARGSRLWLRAYVSARRAASSTTALTFFFVDSDQRADTGGPAQGEALWPALTRDPTRGGYELAAAVRADGSLLGVFDWNAEKQLWAARSNPELVAVAERNEARDPLRLFGDEHAYAQVSIDLAAAKLDDRCLASIFVRTWNDRPFQRAYGDFVSSLAVACRARVNAFGDPELLRSDRCSSDETCPGDGRCSDGICLFSYECNESTACPSSRRCTDNVCVYFVENSCGDNAQCGGLLCQSARCVACTASGERACTGDTVCAPDGRCLSPSAAYSGDPDSNAIASGERVQGGALSCSLTESARGAPCLLLVLLPLAWRWTDRRLRRLRSERGGAR